MDGATPVNTGVVAWPSVDAAGVMVRRMQTKLHRWASEDSTRRFGDLFNLVYDPAFLVDAWQRVANNDGARTAGVDGVTVALIETRVGIGVFLGQIRDLLKSGEYRPSPVRQVKIPKGGGKLRTLGIPTVLDRVVQAACKAVLEPIFEADFLPCSYGFRPNRRDLWAPGAEMPRATRPPQPTRAGRDRRNPPFHLPAKQLSLCVGGRHRSVFRRNRSCRGNGPGAAADQGQAAGRIGEGVPESRGSQ